VTVPISMKIPQTVCTSMKIAVVLGAVRHQDPNPDD